MRKHVGLLLVLFPVCGHLLDVTYYKSTYNTDWTGALAYCRDHYTDLIQVKTKEVNDALKKYSGWIGLSRNNTASPWTWSRGGDIANFIPWHGNDPKTDENCVSRRSDGEWESKHCNDNDRQFMCYDENLILVNENKTWEEALEHCRSMNGVEGEDPVSSYWNHRYDLVTLITPVDYISARNTAQDATTDEVWTGLCYLAGDWLWVGGQPAQYEDLPKCPTESLCGVLEKSGTAKYALRNCQQKRNFLCSKVN